MQTKKTHNLMIFGGILALLAITAVIVLSGVRGGWFKGSLTLPSIPLYYVDINTPAKLNNPDYAQYADGTKSMPFITIKAAVDKLKTEGTSNAIIMVAKGTYNENVNLENFNGIYLLGGYSSTFTSQNTETNETIVNGVMNGTNIGGEISGFTYKNYGSSTSPKIRAIYISNMITPKTITVSNNRFRNSVVNGNFIGIKSMSGGKGIIKDNSFSTVHSVKALIDSVDSAGETIIEKNLIYASRSDETLIKGNAGSIIKNNLISRTGFGNKNSIYGNNAKIINNTIYMDENSTNCIEVIGTSQVNNNLIVICSGKAVQQASTSNVIYNGVWPNDANVGNMNMLRNLKCDPKFTGTTLTSNPVGYKLGATSECIDKGFIDPLVTHDYFGTTRPQGQAHDLGFYEALYVPVCGDGKKEGSEACDDGNILAGDGCSPTCTIEPDLCTNIAGVQTTVPTGYTREGTICIKCGDGIKEGSEKCDDGNILTGDGCSPTCTVESGWTCTLVNQRSVCTRIPTTTDLCTNLPGIQTSIPAGYVREGTICTPVTTPPTPTQEAECGEWTDISKSDPEYGIWVWQCQRNILRGYPDGTLKPENKLNRAELLALAFRASTYEGTGDVNLNLKNCFNDGRGQWYEPYMCTGKDRGFIVGYPGNVFRGENTVILAEGLKMFLGALAKSYSTASEPWFYNMLWDSHLKQLLPYSLRDQNDIVPVGTTELTRRRAVNMLYRIQIMAK